MGISVKKSELGIAGIGPISSIISENKSGSSEPSGSTDTLVSSGTDLNSGGGVRGLDSSRISKIDSDFSGCFSLNSGSGGGGKVLDSSRMSIIDSGSLSCSCLILDSSSNTGVIVNFCNSSAI